MERKVRMISYKCADNEEKMKIGNIFHKNLVGMEAYVNNDIVLNIDADNEVVVYIYDEKINLISLSWILCSVLSGFGLSESEEVTE